MLGVDANGAGTGRELARGVARTVMVACGCLLLAGCGESQGGDGNADSTGATGGTTGGSGTGAAGNGGTGASSVGGSNAGEGGSSGAAVGGGSGSGAQGGSSGGGAGGFECMSGGTQPGVPLEELAARYAEATCAVAERCTADFSFYRKATGSCVGFLTSMLESWTVAPVRRGVEAGTVLYDGQAMATCFERMLSLDCDQDTSMESSCFCAFQGMVPEGGDCLTNTECAGNSRCVPPEGGLCTTGSCQPRPGRGEDCEVQGGDECTAGLDCVMNPDPDPLAFPLICVDRPTEGAPCEFFGGPMCAGYLLCRASSGSGGTCERAEFAGLDEPCSLADAIGCSEGECVSTERSASGDVINRCAPLATSQGTCHRGFPDECPAGEYCPLTAADLINGTFTASCTPYLPPGESCSNVMDGADCGTYPLGCSASDVCEELGDVGESCTSDDGCWSNRCSGAMPVCDVQTVCN